MRFPPMTDKLRKSEPRRGQIFVMERANPYPFVKEPEGEHRHELALLRVKAILRPPDIHWKTGVDERGDQAGSPIEKPATHQCDNPDAKCAHNESGQPHRPLRLAKKQLVTAMG